MNSFFVFNIFEFFVAENFPEYELINPLNPCQG